MHLRFLHISDIHFQVENYQSKRMRMTLLKKLSDLNKVNPFNFVLLTGDLSHQGQGFNKTQMDFLEGILQTLDLSKEQIYIIPGNHDISRNDDRTSILKEISESKNPSNTLDEYLQDEDKKSGILSSFDAFSAFHFDFFEKKYPLNQIHYLLQTENYNIVHINTCLIANRAGEEGTLLIGKNNLYDCLSKLGLDNNKLSIAIGHHTLECMIDSDRNAILNLFDDFNIDMYLSGHVHRAAYNIEANHYSNLLNIVSAGVHSDEYSLGGFGDFLIQNEIAIITQYIWNEEHEYWTLNNTLGRKMESGVLEYRIPKFSVDVNGLEAEIDNKKDAIKRELSELFLENERIFKQYGPFSITALNISGSEIAYMWKEMCITDIIPNNDKTLEILENNKELISDDKLFILDLYKNHIEGFKINHLSKHKSPDVPTFPKEILTILD
ncbi:metallophosphoesterase family protein [Sporosarcina newyorkensis]|uniref:Calcineurin-like phosphoesterase n=1 Tax=Sporosarcina newyorkensis TaxID=759851 RepID=A0A1T4YHR3_9BACL|nr:metallophosphoesterase [Sporosarcina newyorkensis]SKB01326.1 Calcineurin-like phosphoesterase [Sporosarcina newyorkensis]